MFWSARWPPRGHIPPRPRREPVHTVGHTHTHTHTHIHIHIVREPTSTTLCAHVELSTRVYATDLAATIAIATATSGQLTGAEIHTPLAHLLAPMRVRVASRAPASAGTRSCTCTRAWPCVASIASVASATQTRRAAKAEAMCTRSSKGDRAAEDPECRWSLSAKA